MNTGVGYHFLLQRIFPPDPGIELKFLFLAGRFDISFPICWKRKWQPTPVFLPGETHGWRRLMGYSPRGRKESDTTERLNFQLFPICKMGLKIASIPVTGLGGLDISTVPAMQ